MAHVNSVTEWDKNGWYVFSDEGERLAGPFSSHYEGNAVARYLSDKVGEGSISEYRKVGKWISDELGYREPRKQVEHPAQMQHNFDTGAVRGTVGQPEAWSWGNVLPNMERQVEGIIGGPLNELDWKGILFNMGIDLPLTNIKNRKKEPQHGYTNLANRKRRIPEWNPER